MILKTIAVMITENTTARIVVIIVKSSIPFPKSQAPCPFSLSVSRLLAGRPLFTFRLDYTAGGFKCKHIFSHLYIEQLMYHFYCHGWGILQQISH